MANVNVQLTSHQNWDEVEKNTFAVLGMVTAEGEPRTVCLGEVSDASTDTTTANPSPQSHEARAPDDNQQHQRFVITTEET
jgi:hypothetical protein